MVEAPVNQREMGMNDSVERLTQIIIPINKYSNNTGKCLRSRQQLLRKQTNKQVNIVCLRKVT